MIVYYFVFIILIGLLFTWWGVSLFRKSPPVEPYYEVGRIALITFLAIMWVALGWLTSLGVTKYSQTPVDPTIITISEVDMQVVMYEDLKVIIDTKKDSTVLDSMNMWYVDSGYGLYGNFIEGSVRLTNKLQ